MAIYSRMADMHAHFPSLADRSFMWVRNGSDYTYPDSYLYWDRILGLVLLKEGTKFSGEGSRVELKRSISDYDAVIETLRVRFGDAFIHRREDMPEEFDATMESLQVYVAEQIKRTANQTNEQSL